MNDLDAMDRGVELEHARRAPAATKRAVAYFGSGLRRDERLPSRDDRCVALSEPRSRHQLRAEDVRVDDDRTARPGKRSRFDRGEEGLTFFFGQLLDHHAVVRGGPARAAQQLLDRKLEVLLVSAVRTVGRHGHLECSAEPIRSDGPLARGLSRGPHRSSCWSVRVLDRLRQVPAGGVRKLRGS